MTSTSFFNHAVCGPGHREPNPLQVVSTGTVAYRLHQYLRQASQPAHRRATPPQSVVAGALRVGIAQNPAQFSSKRICLMSVGPASKLSGFLPLLVAATIGFAPVTASAETLEIGIGAQNTTTNTVTGGVVLKELGLLEKHLPKTGKYKDFQYKLSWQNATSGPPITNGMMANNIQIGMMGDYPLMVNGATGQAKERNPARRHHRLQRGRRRQRHRRSQGLAVL